MPLDDPPSAPRAPDPPSATMFVQDLRAVEANGALGDPLRNGMPIPGFTILTKLGEGGMGVVYHARDVKLNRDVALKVAPADTLAGSREMIRFLSEAQMLASIVHPHVVRVLEYGEHAGRPYLAMEYLTGGTLADRLQNGAMTPAAAASLIRETALAVHAAHAAGIVHRDLKPRNILFDAAGEPNVTDFGIAKRSASELTATQEVMGTPAYMAPEQAKGGTKFVGPAADIWALGAILYECITGVRPFTGAGINSVLYRVVHDDPKTPRTLRAAISPDLERICLKCLRKEPADRYATAEALAEDLDNFIHGRPISVRQPGLAERTLRWARRDPSRATAYALTAVVIGLIALGTVLGLFWQKAEQARGFAVIARDQADEARKRTEEAHAQLDLEKTKSDRLAAEALLERDAAKKARAEEEEAKKSAEKAREQEAAARKEEAAARKEVEKALEKSDRIEYSKIVDLAHREFLVNNAERSRELLPLCPPKFRGWEWDFVTRLCGPNVAAYIGEHTGPLGSANYNADGTLVLTASADGTARIWDATSGRSVITIKAGKAPLTAARFSPDGSQAATASMDGTVKVWNAKTGDLIVSIPAHAPVAVSVAYSPDGTKLLSTGWDKTAKIWNAKSGEAIATMGGGGLGYRSAVFNHDGSRVLTAGVDGAARLWDPATQKEVATLRGLPLPLEAAVYNRDGSRILIAWSDGSVRVWDVAKEEEAAAINVGLGGIVDSAINEDGRTVATAGLDGIVRIWDVDTSKETSSFKVHRNGLATVAFHPNGGCILTGDLNGNARAWDLARPPEEIELVSRDRGLECLAVSPDGRRVAARKTDGSLGVIDGVKWQPLKESEGAYTAAAFNKDGTRLALAGEKGSNGLWNPATGERLGRIADVDDDFTCAAHTRDGFVLATSKGSAYLMTETGPATLCFRGPVKPVKAIAVDRDGLIAAAVYADGTGTVWQINGRTIAEFLDPHDGFNSVDFFPDGKHVVTGGLRGTVRLWNAETGKDAGTLSGGRPIGIVVAVNPDGTRILTGSPNGKVRLWDVASGAEVFEREVVRGRLDCVAFTPDGCKIIAGATGSKVLLWDATPLKSKP